MRYIFRSGSRWLKQSCSSRPSIVVLGVVMASFDWSGIEGAASEEAAVRSGRVSARAFQGFSIYDSGKRYNAHIDAKLAAGYNPYGAAADAAGWGGFGFGCGEGVGDGDAGGAAVMTGSSALPFLDLERYAITI